MDLKPNCGPFFLSQNMHVMTERFSTKRKQNKKSTTYNAVPFPFRVYNLWPERPSFRSAPAVKAFLLKTEGALWNNLSAERPSFHSAPAVKAFLLKTEGALWHNLSAERPSFHSAPAVKAFLLKRREHCEVNFPFYHNSELLSDSSLEIPPFENSIWPENLRKNIFHIYDCLFGLFAEHLLQGTKETGKPV